LRACVLVTFAWDFLESHQACQPWLFSDSTWISSQSLCLLKIRSNTRQHYNHYLPFPFETHPVPSSSIEQRPLITSVALCSDFGFTVGATPDLLTCITEITSLASQIHRGGISTSLLPSIAQLRQKLETYQVDLGPVPLLRTRIPSHHHPVFLVLSRKRP